MSTPLTDVQIASQLPPAQRLMLVQVQRGDDIDPRNGATRHALEGKGLLKETTGWESMQLTDQGLEVAAACPLATLNSLSKEARGVLLDVANNRYDPQHRFRFHLSSASLAIVSDKAGTATLTSLGICTAALAMMEETPAPVVEAAPEPAAPAIEAQPTETDPRKIAALLSQESRKYLTEIVWGNRFIPGDDLYHSLLKYKLVKGNDGIPAKVLTTPLGNQVASILFETPVNAPDAKPHIAPTPSPIEDAQPPAAPVNLTPDDEAMLMQALYSRPIRPQNPKTRDRLVELGLLIVESEYMWTLSLTNAGRQAAEKLDILRGLTKFDLCKLWHLLHGKPVHERELSDSVRAFALATFDESKDLNKRGMAALTEAGRAAAQRTPRYVADKLTKLYPTRGQALIDLIRGSDTRISEGLSKTLWDWGVIELARPDAKLTAFGRAVAVECAAILGQPIDVDTPPDESTPAAPVVETAPEPAQQIAELASGVGYDLETAQEAAPAEPAAPIEESQPAPAPTDDRAALLAENERLRAALLEANDALAAEWLKAQDKQMIGKKIGAQHKQVQQILRSNSEAASRRALKVEAENIDLKRQLADLKKAQAAPAASDPDETHLLRADLATAIRERDDLKKRLKQTEKDMQDNARDKFNAQRQHTEVLESYKKQADLLDATTARAKRAESDLANLQLAAKRWQAEHAAATAEVSKLRQQIEALTAITSTGHDIITDATPAHLDRLAAEKRAILHMQFMTDGKLYVVAGPRTHPQSQPEKPATDHIDDFDDMVAFEDADIIDIDDRDPAPDPVEQPVFVFDSGDTTDDPDGTQQMLKMMREGARPDATSRALDERNKAAARADFARRMPATPSTSRSAPPRPALTSGQ